jgi:bifunctional DNase/RNase
MTMIEVVIDSVRASLMTNHRMIILRETDRDRYLPIFIGPPEADAIAVELLGRTVSRPLTHDLLRVVIDSMGGRVSHVLVNDLRDDTFFARIIMDVNGEKLEVDSRPSDAIALAVRVKAPIFVNDSVMDQAGVVPEEGISELTEEQTSVSKEDLSAFRDFVEGLDLDDFGFD